MIKVSMPTTYKPSLGGLGREAGKMNSAIAKIKGRTLNGLKMAQAIIHRDMDVTPPLVPVRYGNLRMSYYAVSSTPAVLAGRSTKFKDVKEQPGVYAKLVKGHKETLEVQKARAKVEGKVKGPTVIIGYSAFYALYVHEMVGKGNGRGIAWTRPDSGPKWFQAAIARNKGAVIKILRENARIPK